MSVKSLKVRALVTTLSISLAGILAIQGYEGTRQVAYYDSVRVPTICTGSTKNVYIGQKATLRECEQRLQEDTTYAGKGVAKAVHVRLTQGQYDALVSFVFNIGGTAFGKSTFVRKLNAAVGSTECRAAASEILRWDKAKGKRLRGLTERRQGEYRDFVKDCDAWDD